MSFQKFQADHLFTGTEILSGEQVLICSEEGVVIGIVDFADAGDDVKKYTGVISPGFINCHCHLELSHMKGIVPEKTGLVDFVFSVVSQRHFLEEEILQAISNAEAEMIRNGIVAVGDICNNTLTINQKEQKNLDYFNFVETTGWLPSGANERFSRSKDNFQRFSCISPSSIVPHAPYSVSEDLWNLIKPYYQNKVVSIHNQETAFEDELFIQNSGDFVRMYELMKMDTSFFQPSGKSSLQTYFDKLTEAHQIILVHNTFTKQQDIDFIKSKRAINKTSFCLCINANQYIEQALPPVDLFIGNNCHIVLGTDSLASNWSLSIWDEIKTIAKHFPHIAIEEILQWATFNGAIALQMQDKLGSFIKGKKPGVVLLEGLYLTNKESIRSTNLKKLL